MNAMLDEPERRRMLDAEIAAYVAVGYRVQARTTTSAQLIRPKRFSASWAIAWFLLCGVGVLVYLFYYWGRTDEAVYLSLDDTGQVQRTGAELPKSPAPRAPSGWTCAACGRVTKDRYYDCSWCGARRPA